MNIDRASAVDDLPISPLTLEESSNDITSPSTVPSSNGSVPSGSHAEDVVENVKEDVVKDLSSVGGDDVLGENLERDGEVPVSPSSSGCDDARDEIEDVDTDSNHGAMTVNSAADGAPWVPGKRYHDEDDSSISWRKRRKHFFVLSNSGKPIYSRYGDEHKLAGFSATLQAIISFVENGGDHVKFVRAGKHQVVFLVKGPIYLVCISCTEDPYESLKGQLELIYGQVLLILTKSVNKCFEKNSKFDMTPLLGGTEDIFSSLIHAFGWNPATFLHAYTCLPLTYSSRQAVCSILQDVADSGVLFSILMCKHKVISLEGAQKTSLHPDDMLLLSNFVLASESFRTSESFSPICLPRYNPMGFLYAYVHFIDIDTYLVLLTTNSDAFYHLKDCRKRIESVLVKLNVLGEIQKSKLDGNLHVENLPNEFLLSGPLQKNSEVITGVGGPSGLWHFIYRSVYLDQYVSSEFSSPLKNSKQQKRLYRCYQNLYISMHDRETGPYRTQFKRDENYALLCWITQDFELYAAFDPLADKVSAIKTCNKVCHWIRNMEKEIFLLGANPFSW
ncbi:hypothetical protein ZOSMA_8G01360 [Zostera marina]|uniref:Vacuolar fusion protein MON1 homolog n=1 Tax=Zostera marina TaxID=29655 RepID=A0A0K9NJP6_ZOSMR|nr:hypothetical protein ZOSMA_8G01360 [Zostera marina]